MEHETGQPDMRALLLRKLAWDVFPHDNDIVREVQQQLGLVPSDEDGLDFEHDQSDTRINRLAPLAPALRNLSRLAAEVTGLYMIFVMEAHADAELEIPEEFLEGFTQQNTEIIFESVHSILCHLLDVGALAYGEKVSAP